VSEEQLLSRIEARAKADCESILDRANKDAERIRGAAQQKAEITKRRKTADARHRWLAERRLIEGQGVLDACRLLTQTRGEAIAKVRESVFSDLAQWLEKPLYENALKELLLECVEAISVDANVQPVKILCSERDKRRFQGLLKKHNVT
jgi:vacuolar-type H+-ATPase subunit E/Vma4